MPNLNEVRLMGNLTRDPEIKYTTNGTAVCGFGLAINRTWLNDRQEKMEETTFVDVEFWGKKAEAIAKYVKKGHPFYVAGRLKLDQWDDKQTGQKRSKLRVVGEDFQFLKNKEGGGEESHDRSGEYDQSRGQGSGYGRSGQQQRQQTQQQPRPPAGGSDAPLDFPEDEDDVPF